MDNNFIKIACGIMIIVGVSAMLIGSIKDAVGIVSAISIGSGFICAFLYLIYEKLEEIAKKLDN